jgi:hypothetical protein
MAFNRPVVHIDMQFVHRILGPAHEHQQPIIRQEALALHPRFEPVKLAVHPSRRIRRAVAVTPDRVRKRPRKSTRNKRYNRFCPRIRVDQ